MNSAKNKMEELKKQLESRLHREFTKTEISILNLAFEAGQEEGRQAQKEYILNLIQNNA